ncbi:SIS domain-containing protein [Novibacillus thermophilus]|jgi:uncharacterized phosphosugar-binding protein|uniref:UPF0309 protein B0W44_08155 n=1 Tax=Novibacillus thermophilus TaxID=1471761 RepID=A0A1U9K6X9_9BACL|nr:SIS domain-containing protein [Novibacillus thermophilus]AQS55766.1 hypothetical protein B0W44_08155 [Novibacillus thermophilus]
MIEAYFAKMQALLKDILKNEKDHMEQVSEKIVDSLKEDGVVHLFGAGHSHMLTEEVFYRAGGLVPVHPILDTGLMLHEGAVRSSDLERMNGYGEIVMKHQDIRPGEVVFVISNSGRNPVPIEVALAAKEQGAFVVGLTSLDYSSKQSSRHKSGKRLFEIVDVVIDNHGVEGDAILKLEAFPVPFAPSSTVAGAAIINAILARAIEHLVNEGIEPPVFLSGNLDGADEHNLKLVNKYKNRIPEL